MGTELTLKYGSSLEAINELKETLGDIELNASIMPRWSNPSGKGNSFTIYDEEVKELKGVLLMHKYGRALYEDSNAVEGKVPVCVSFGDRREDGALIGVLNVAKDDERLLKLKALPTLSCDTCPFNEYPAQCKESRQLVLLTKEYKLPVLGRVPRTSLKQFKQFISQLINKGLSSTSCEIVITLEPAKSEGGVDYKKLKFSLGERLSQNEELAIKQYKAAILGKLENVAKDDLKNSSAPSEEIPF